MNWKFWQRRPRKTYQELIDEIETINSKVREEEEAKRRAEWDALPDHRKAARIEYRYFQQMARPRIKFVQPSIELLANVYAQQQAGPMQYSALNQGMQQQRAISIFDALL